VYGVHLGGRVAAQGVRALQVRRRVGDKRGRRRTRAHSPRSRSGLVASHAEAGDAAPLPSDPATEVHHGWLDAVLPQATSGDSVLDRVASDQKKGQQRGGG